MPREELMQYMAQVLDITAKSTRSYDLSCSISVQLYTDADVYVQMRPLPWSVWLIDRMVGYLLVFADLDGELWPFVGDLLSGSRLMEGGEIFSAGGTYSLTLIYIDFQ